MISILNTPHEILIASNTFTDNSVIDAAIYIESDARSRSVLIYKNTFTNTASYFGDQAITIIAKSGATTND